MIVVHTSQRLHEVTNFLPLIVVAFKQVVAMLDRYYDRSAVADLRLSWKSQECACSKRDDRGNGRLRRRLFFMMAEWTRIEDAIRLLVILNSLVAEVYGRFRSASSELSGILIHVVKVVLFFSEVSTATAQQLRHLHRTLRPCQSFPQR